jgi:hypothetical protein
MSVFQSMIVWKWLTLNFYIKCNEGERERTTGETERERERIIASGTSTKFRKIIIEKQSGDFHAIRDMMSATVIVLKITTLI